MTRCRCARSYFFSGNDRRILHGTGYFTRSLTLTDLGVSGMTCAIGTAIFQVLWIVYAGPAATGARSGKRSTFLNEERKHFFFSVPNVTRTDVV